MYLMWKITKDWDTSFSIPIYPNFELMILIRHNLNNTPSFDKIDVLSKVAISNCSKKKLCIWGSRWRSHDTSLHLNFEEIKKKVASNAKTIEWKKTEILITKTHICLSVNLLITWKKYAIVKKYPLIRTAALA